MEALRKSTGRLLEESFFKESMRSFRKSTDSCRKSTRDSEGISTPDPWRKSIEMHGFLKEITGITEEINEDIKLW